MSCSLRSCSSLSFSKIHIHKTSLHGIRADTIAKSVLDQFNKLPAKRKPLVRGNGLHEWVPISGIVAEKDGNFQCISLATGMKCLPASKIPEANGIGLHDWHAEILAIRTFNRFILDECARIAENGSSELIEISSPSESSRPFRLRQGIKLHMYASEAPCGDASMENLMAAQEDASPWEVPQAAVKNDAGNPAPELPGRAYFSQLGVVRRKPARSDAPPTLSKSCSDKLALKQCTSLLAALPSLFVDVSSAYIDTLVLPEDQYSETACDRAFGASGRMSSVAGNTFESGYSFRPFTVATTALQFQFSRREVLARSEKIVASNLAAAWSASGIEESTMGGMIQGHKPFLPKGASRMCRRHMWQSCRDLAKKLPEWPALAAALSATTYGQIKETDELQARQKAKLRAREEALPGWIRNTGDDTFSIE